MHSNTSLLGTPSHPARTDTNNSDGTINPYMLEFTKSMQRLNLNAAPNQPIHYPDGGKSFYPTTKLDLQVAEFPQLYATAVSLGLLGVTPNIPVETATSMLAWCSLP
ncbi:hypothetical protein AMATHDRAFT_47940 [Amanita thiersii Skay4041]|uniref:Uncharacterized protein n=1 Tax=Amanita thiersii Skay4041 TaxID=703135 RepID=A0A2A9NM24_9AGAR|nr:hypothetical protein AMATHDRAFT_47940 [Amanita thiersii Skay4041]